MKKLFVLGSIAAALVITGCSTKTAETPEPEKKQEMVTPAPSMSGGFDGSRDNFVSVDERINYIENYLEKIYFDFDQFSIRADMQDAINTDVEILSSIAAAPLTARIEGHTDEWGTDEYNYALGLKRAASVRDALVAKGVNQDKTILVSYGESKPSCTDKVKECWAENRKVTFKMLP